MESISERDVPFPSTCLLGFFSAGCHRAWPKTVLCVLFRPTPTPAPPPARLPRAPSSGVSLLRQMFRDARGCVCFTFPSSSFVTHSGNVMQNSTVINATLGFHLFLLIFCQASVTWLPNSNSDELAPPPPPKRGFGTVIGQSCQTWRFPADFSLVFELVVGSLPVFQ